jgi:hypothetical protein
MSSYDTLFNLNYAAVGGAIYVYNNSTYENSILSKFYNNRADYYGGAIYSYINS